MLLNRQWMTVLIIVSISQPLFVKGTIPYLLSTSIRFTSTANVRSFLKEDTFFELYPTQDFFIATVHFLSNFSRTFLT